MEHLPESRGHSGAQQHFNACGLTYSVIWFVHFQNMRVELIVFQNAQCVHRSTTFLKHDLTYWIFLNFISGNLRHLMPLLRRPTDSMDFGSSTKFMSTNDSPVGLFKLHRPRTRIATSISQTAASISHMSRVQKTENLDNLHILRISTTTLWFHQRFTTKNNTTAQTKQQLSSQVFHTTVAPMGGFGHDVLPSCVAIPPPDNPSSFKVPKVYKNWACLALQACNTTYCGNKLVVMGTQTATKKRTCPNSTS